MEGARGRVRVLGPVQVVWPNGVVVDPGSPTQRRILGALAVAPRRPVRADSLAEIAGLSLSALRVSISRLRKLLGAEAITTGPAGYSLEVDTDAQHLVAALAAAGRDLTLLDAALANWQGDPFAEFANEPWAIAEVARLGELHAAAIETRAEVQLESGRAGDAVAALVAHIATHPWRDRPRGLLIRALAASGRTREALQSYQQYRTMLGDESGIEPSAELRAIERRVAGGWDGLVTATSTTPGTEHLALPATSRRQADATPLIGRHGELASLADALAGAIEGRRLGSVTVVGDAGIGKTSLVQHFAAAATAAGALVLGGRCDESVAVPLQPFRSVIGQLVDVVDDDLIDAHAQVHAQTIALIAPGFARRTGVHDHAGIDELSDRFLLFEAVADLLRRASVRSPLVLVLDDLHWAEPTALQLVRHVVRVASDAPILVIVSTRAPDELHADLRASLADIARAPSVRIDLAGLGRSPLTELVCSMSRVTDGDIAPEVIETLETETAGNPLLATHLVQHWLDTGRVDISTRRVRFAAPGADAAPLPPTLRDILWARLRSIGRDAPAVLAAASVLGDEISERLLEQLVDVPGDVVTGVLDAAARAGIVTVRPERPGTIRFTHALVASAVEADLPATKRRRLHERAARLLEASIGEEVAPSMSMSIRIASHWERAGSTIDAARWALDAGDAALRSLAADEAVHWYRRSLGNIDLLGESGAPGASDQLRVRALTALGIGLQRVGDRTAHDTLIRAAELARRLGDRPMLVQATEAMGRGSIRLGDFTPTYLGLVDDALAVTAPDDHATRARLLAMLAAALRGTSDPQRREQAALESVALADASDDPLLLARLAPDVLRAMWSPDTAEVRTSIADRAIVAAGADPYIRFTVNIAAFDTAVNLGDAQRSRAALAALHEVLDMRAEPTMRWLCGVSDTFCAMMAGRLDEADRLAHAGVELGMSIGEPEAFSVFGSQYFVIGTFAGRYGEILPVIDQVLANGETALPFRLAHAIACAVSGRRDEAAAVLAVGRDGGFAAVPRDMLWLTSIVGYAVLAIELDDRVAAAELLTLLAPYAGQVAFNGATSQGPVAAYLGRLASMLGRHDEADEFLYDALTTVEAFGWTYHRASTLVCLAESRLRRTGTIDLEAQRLLDGAERLCIAHGFGWWAGRITALRGSTTV